MLNHDTTSTLPLIRTILYPRSVIIYIGWCSASLVKHELLQLSLVPLFDFLVLVLCQLKLVL